MSENIKNFIQASVNEKPVAAYKSISQELKSRISSKMDAMRTSLAKNLFSAGDKHE